MKDETQTLEGAYQKSLSELKWKIQLDAKAEYKNEPTEICHFGRRKPIEAISPTKSEKDKGRRIEKYKKGNSYRPRHKFRKRERVRYWLRLFVAASHETGLDTRSKARRPIKMEIKGRGRSGTSRDSNPAGLCCSSTH